MKSGTRWRRLLVWEVAGVVVVAAVLYWIVTRAPGRQGLVVVTPLVGATVTAPATWTPRPPTPTRPPATATPTLAPTATPTITVQVAATGGGLRLRATPGTAGEVIRELGALTLLTVVGRTEDNAWLEVVTPAGERGWVNTVYVDLTASVDGVAVTGQAEDAAVSAVSYLSGVTSHAREIFLNGLALGNKDYVFSMVGDSNTDNPAFLLPFDTGDYALGEHDYLQLTIDYFKGSFSRDSAAAVGSYNTAKILNPGDNHDGRCQSSESLLACEYRLNQPSVALILLGSGDQHSWQGFEGRYRQIIEYSIARGVIPVLITKADDLEHTDNTAPSGFINAAIRQLAVEYDVPLLDLRLALAALPNLGLGPDNLHYNVPPDGHSAYFDAAHLQYGYTMRNLTALQALDALRQYVLYAPQP
ncbi:MAG: SH3 domain-containing protein [Anaerolineales bacterium]|nr:SH3 domain-containing protein [Anaerolineales bacterium]